MRMEEEREALQGQSHALDDRQKQQIQSLEKVCVFYIHVRLEIAVL